MRFSLFLLVASALVSLGVSSAQAAAVNDTPRIWDAVCLEPYGADIGLGGAGFMNRAQQQGYLMTIRRQANWTFPPAVRLSDFASDLYLGYGIWWQSTHGSTTGFAAEAYPFSNQGLVARNNAMVSYAQAGFDTINHIYASRTVSNTGYHISIRPAYLAQRFYSWRTLVFNGACQGNSYASSWTNARCVLDYNFSCLVGQPGVDSDNLFSRMNGEYGPDLRTVRMALGSTQLSMTGNNLTVLSPRIDNDNVGTQLDARRHDVFIGFDTPMDQDVPPWKVVRANWPLEVWNTEYTTDGIRFTLLSRSKGTFSFQVIAADPQYGREGAQSTGRVPLDCDGIGPNRDNKFYTITSTYIDDKPAAAIDGFAAVRGPAGVTVEWRAEQEQLTAKYLVEYGADWSGPFSLSAEVPVSGTCSYQLMVPNGQPGVYRLREVETDGDTLVHWSDKDSALEANVPFALELGNVDSTCAALLANRPTFNGAMSGTTEYFIYAPQQFRRMAEYLAGYWRDYRGVPTEVVTLESIGGAANIKSHVATNLPNGGYVLLYADGNEEQSIDGRPMRADLSLYAKGWTRDSYPAQASLNIIPSFYTVDPDSQNIALSYWTPFRCGDWWYVDMDGDGLPDPGRFIGRAPVSDTTEAWAFAWKTIGTMFQNPNPPANMMPSAGFWTYAQDNSGNSGTYAKGLFDSLVVYAGQFNPYLYRMTIASTDANPLTTAQRNAAAKSALDQGRSLVTVLSTVAQHYHLGAYLHVDTATPFDVNSLVANGQPAFGLGISCGLGDFDRTENPAVGTPVMERLLLVQNRGFYGFFGATRGAFQVAAFRIGREFLRRQYGTPPGQIPPTVGQLATETVRAVATQYPYDAEVAKEFVLLGDPHLRIPNPSYPVVGVGEVALARPLTILSNPSHGQAQFAFHVSERQPVDLTIHDIQGRRIATVLQSVCEGAQVLRWNGRTADGKLVRSGVYVVWLRIGHQQWQQKLVLLR